MDQGARAHQQVGKLRADRRQRIQRPRRAQGHLQHVDAAGTQRPRKVQGQPGILYHQHGQNRSRPLQHHIHSQAHVSSPIAKFPGPCLIPPCRAGEPWK
ncbi:hypothetical protein D3C81_2010120 [compost metagenome]